MQLTNATIKKTPRNYYSQDLNIEDWSVVQEEWEKLINLPINNEKDLISFLEQSSELNSILSEEMAWRYIHMTCHADQEEYEKAFNDFYATIISQSQPFDFQVKKKYYDNPFRNALPAIRFSHYNKIVSNDIELFREENIPLMVKESELSSKYGAIYGKMTVDMDGEEKTMQQLAVYLKSADRSVREKAWRLRMDRMKVETEKFNSLFDEMKEIRIQMAKNTDFSNYRDYMHQLKGRFSYTPEELYQFHDAVEKEVIPFLQELNGERKAALQVDALKPWDSSVDLDGKILKPYEEVDEMIQKAISIMYQVKPEYGIELNKMYNTGLLDLENRKGKAPGGYNYPLEELGTSFIFMNAVKVHDDVTTLLHESGHAMHSRATSTEPIGTYRGTPSEVAELASMSMELLTMDYWSEYYKDSSDLKKAKKDQLEGTLKFLPWCMTVDALQHWIYLNPNHTVAERTEYYLSLINRFNAGIDWTGLEEEKKIGWLFQLHIFEVPFYYIEYAMSQLGALAIYKNYKEKGKSAIDAYDSFLKLGYSKSVRELYEAAGIRFDFSAKNIKEIVQFVKNELQSL